MSGTIKITEGVSKDIPVGGRLVYWSEVQNSTTKPEDPGFKSR
jgi:hypothetical protein